MLLRMMTSPKRTFWKNKFMVIRELFSYYNVHVSRQNSRTILGYERIFFHSTCIVNGKVCHFIIELGSCENVVSEDVVRKLSLKVEVHLSPYCLAWLKQGSEIKVSNRALLPLSIDTTYKDDIYCNVVPMNACHILLSWPWQFDWNVVHDGKHNTHSFYFENRNITLLPSKELICVGLGPSSTSKPAMFLSRSHFETKLHDMGMCFVLIMCPSH